MCISSSTASSPPVSLLISFTCLLHVDVHLRVYVEIFQTYLPVRKSPDIHVYSVDLLWRVEVSEENFHRPENPQVSGERFSLMPLHSHAPRSVSRRPTGVPDSLHETRDSRAHSVDAGTRRRV